VKRFFEIGTDIEVSVAENEDYLKSDLIRLKMVLWMLEKFKQATRKSKAGISTGLSCFMCNHSVWLKCCRYFCFRGFSDI